MSVEGLASILVIVSCLLMNNYDYVHRWKTAESTWSVRKAQHHYCRYYVFSVLLISYSLSPAASYRENNINHGRRLPQLYLVLDYYNNTRSVGAACSKITCVLSFGMGCDGYLPYISPCKYSSDQSSIAYVRPKKEIHFYMHRRSINCTHSIILRPHVSRSAAPGRW